MNDSNTTSVDALRPPAAAYAISVVPAELHGLSERAHPLARRDYYTLMDRSDADLRWVLEAADARLGNVATLAKREQAHFTVRCFVEAHGDFPGARELERRPKADPVRKRVLLSDGAIRKAFGRSWVNVEAALKKGTADVDLTARRLTALGPSFSKDELLAVGRLFIAALPPIAQSATFRPRRLPRRPASQQHHGAATGPESVRRLPPSVRRVRGLLGRAWSGAPVTLRDHPLAGAAERPRHVTIQGPTLPRNRGAAPGGVRAAAELFGTLLSYPQYNAFRAKAVLVGHQRGEHVPWPHPRTLIGKYGTWPGVKLAAGIFTKADVASGAQRNAFSDDELVDALAQAVLDCGATLTASCDYRLWKVERQTQLAAQGKPPRIPSTGLLSQRLGGPTHRFTVARGSPAALVGVVGVVGTRQGRCAV